MKKIVKIRNLNNYHDSVKADLSFWLSKTPEERISAVELLRRQYYHENTPRLQRSVRIIKRQ